MEVEREGAPAGTGSEESLERLEWRGILALSGELLFSLHDRETKDSFWIGLHQVMSDFEVTAYHDEENELTVRHGDATRTFSLSGSTVQPLEEDLPTEEPEAPVVESSAPPEEISDEQDPAEEEDQSLVEEPTEETWEEPAEGTAEEADPWREAIDNVPGWGEVDQQFQALDAAEDGVNDILARHGPDDPEYEAAVERRHELLEARRLLTELALTELRGSPSLSEGIQEKLAEELRADYAARVSSPRPASVEPGDDGRPMDGVPSTGEESSPEDD
jgi:hypothetical protein